MQRSADGSYPAVCESRQPHFVRAHVQNDETKLFLWHGTRQQQLQRQRVQCYIFIFNSDFLPNQKACLTCLPPFNGPRASIQLSQSILYVLLEQRRISRMPPTQCRPAFCNVTSSPHDPQVIDRGPGLVVGNEDVEVPIAYTIKHIQNRLLSRPSTGRFFGYQSITSQARVGPSRTSGT